MRIYTNFEYKQEINFTCRISPPPARPPRSCVLRLAVRCGPRVGAYSCGWDESARGHRDGGTCGARTHNEKVALEIWLLLCCPRCKIQKNRPRSPRENIRLMSCHLKLHIRRPDPRLYSVVAACVLCLICIIINTHTRRRTQQNNTLSLSKHSLRSRISVFLLRERAPTIKSESSLKKSHLHIALQLSCQMELCFYTKELFYYTLPFFKRPEAEMPHIIKSLFGQKSQIRAVN